VRPDNAYQRSLDIAQRLADDDPDNADYQRELSVSLDKIGDVAARHGRLSEADNAYQRSLDIAQRLR